jgi:hypothetical protein
MGYLLTPNLISTDSDERRYLEGFPLQALVLYSPESHPNREFFSPWHQTIQLRNGAAHNRALDTRDYFEARTLCLAPETLDPMMRIKKALRGHRVEEISTGGDADVSSRAATAVPLTLNHGSTRG